MIPLEARVPLAFIIGILVDWAVANHWLLPDQKQFWVDGVLTIIGAVGTISLTSIALWHEYIKAHEAQKSGIKSAPVKFPLVGLLSALASFVFVKKTTTEITPAATGETTTTVTTEEQTVQ